MEIFDKMQNLVEELEKKVPRQKRIKKLMKESDIKYSDSEPKQYESVLEKLSFLDEKIKSE